MRTIKVQLADSLHLAAWQLAEKELMSVNDLINLALAEKVSELAQQAAESAAAREHERHETVDWMRAMLAGEADPQRV